MNLVFFSIIIILSMLHPQPPPIEFYGKLISSESKEHSTTRYIKQDNVYIPHVDIEYGILLVYKSEEFVFSKYLKYYSLENMLKADVEYNSRIGEVKKIEKHGDTCYFK